MHDIHVILVNQCLLVNTFYCICFLTSKVQLDGLGLVDQCSVAHFCFHDSEKLTAPLIIPITAQCTTQTTDCNHVHQLKQSINKNNCDHQTLFDDTLYSQCSSFFNTVTSPRNLGHLPALLLCQYRNMAFICTRMIFKMLYLCIMV